MTTTVSTSKTQPAVVMDKLHIDTLTFKQARENNPKRVIGTAGVLYGLDGSGNKVFDKETFSVNDLDFDATVVAAYVAAGGTAASFAADYAAAKTQINNEIAAGTLSDALLMAYFEAALGRIFELHGKIGISGVA